jgi:hypothetical protein
MAPNQTIYVLKRKRGTNYVAAIAPGVHDKRVMTFKRTRPVLYDHVRRSITNGIRTKASFINKQTLKNLGALYKELETFVDKQSEDLHGMIAKLDEFAFEAEDGADKAKSLAKRVKKQNKRIAATLLYNANLFDALNIIISNEKKASRLQIQNQRCFDTMNDEGEDPSMVEDLNDESIDHEDDCNDASEDDDEEHDLDGIDESQPIEREDTEILQSTIKRNHANNDIGIEKTSPFKKATNITETVNQTFDYEPDTRLSGTPHFTDFSCLDKHPR